MKKTISQIITFTYFQIRDSKNGILSKKEGMSHQAKASFTTEMADTYELCIVSHISPGKMEFSSAGWAINWMGFFWILQVSVDKSMRWTLWPRRESKLEIMTV